MDTQHPLLKAIDDEEDHYEWGGGETPDGGLEPGIPDFEKLREEARKVVDENRNLRNAIQRLYEEAIRG